MQDKDKQGQGGQSDIGKDIGKQDKMGETGKQGGQGGQVGSQPGQGGQSKPGQGSSSGR